jgi:hypothetical protein
LKAGYLYLKRHTSGAVGTIVFVRGWNEAAGEHSKRDNFAQNKIEIGEKKLTSAWPV